MPRFRGPRVRGGFTLIEILVVITIIAILLSLLIAAVQNVRALATRMKCGNNLRNLIIAMHAFESTQRQLPAKHAGLPGRFSMHVDLLPHIEQQTVYDRIDFTIDRPTIKDVLLESAEVLEETSHVIQSKASRTPMPLFVCPSDFERFSFSNSYGPVVSSAGAQDQFGNPLDSWMLPDEETVFPLPPKPPTNFVRRLPRLRLEQITDGTGQTMALAERVKGSFSSGRTQKQARAYEVGQSAIFIVRDGTILAGQDNQMMVDACRQSTTASNANDASGCIWYQHVCRWLGCVNVMGPPNSRPCDGGSQGNLAAYGIAPPSSNHPGGANTVMMDATVRFLTNEIDLRVMHGLGTVHGHESMGGEGF